MLCQCTFLEKQCLKSLISLFESFILDFSIEFWGYYQKTKVVQIIWRSNCIFLCLRSLRWGVQIDRQTKQFDKREKRGQGAFWIIERLTQITCRGQITVTYGLVVLSRSLKVLVCVKWTHYESRVNVTVTWIHPVYHLFISLERAVDP